MIPVVWTIAGSDSGGEAGIQADLKTIHHLGAHGCSVITAITAQNRSRVSAIEASSKAIVDAQLKSLKEALPANAIKIGMLGSEKIVEVVASSIKNARCPVIIDPVLIASSGSPLSSKEAQNQIVSKLFPLATLITPNLDEASKLTNVDSLTLENIPQAAHQLRQTGAKAVLIKGGHLNHDYAMDYFLSEHQAVWLSHPRVPISQAHGTGCTLSSAIATGLALGHSLLDAVVFAKAYLNQGLRIAHKRSISFSPIAHQPWPVEKIDFPSVHKAPPHSVSPEFLPINTIGFYPLVETAKQVEALVQMGVRTVQLRNKNLEKEALRQEVFKALASTNRYGANLILNDHWQLAIEAKTFGVHLGQEDLNNADLDQIRRANLRLGISTHSYAELARALAHTPSYVALGPIYPTKSKTVSFPVQGIEKLREWVHLSSVPVIAIGGIELEKIHEIRQTACGGYAVIRGLDWENLATTLPRWLGEESRSSG